MQGGRAAAEPNVVDKSRQFIVWVGHTKDWSVACDWKEWIPGSN